MRSLTRMESTAQLAPWLGVVLLLAPLNQARADNLPEVGSEPARLGRITTFGGVKPIAWGLPMAFSSDFSCSPGDGERYCILRVFNTLNDSERASLNASLLPGQQLGFFRDLDVAVTDSIEESFSKLAPSLEHAPPLLLKTLAFTYRNSYASISARVSKDEAERLMHLYDSEGLGTFSSTVTFRGEHTEDYLELSDTSALHALLEQAVATPLEPARLKKELQDALHQSTLIAHNLTPLEALAIARYTLLATYFTLNAQGNYVAKAEKTATVPKRLVMIDETYSPLRTRCRANLKLSRQATQLIACEKEGS